MPRHLNFINSYDRDDDPTYFLQRHQHPDHAKFTCTIAEKGRDDLETGNVVACIIIPAVRCLFPWTIRRRPTKGDVRAFSNHPAIGASCGITYKKIPAITLYSYADSSPRDDGQFLENYVTVP